MFVLVLLFAVLFISLAVGGVLYGVHKMVSK
jgi:hypothetical protein